MARHVVLEGILNFRDIGGYTTADGRTVKTGCLFRSDELHTLTDSDLEVIAALGVRVVFDLRNDAERTLRPNRLWGGVEVHERESPSHNVETAGKTIEDDIRSGFTNDPDDAVFAGVYIDLLTRLAPELRRVLELAVDAQERPLLFHCAAGKDRTGITAALLLGLLGVDDETILDDYELTTTLATPTRFARVAHLVEEYGRNADHVRTFLSARRPVLATALAHMHDTYGGYEGYATDALGAPADITHRLRDRLLA